MPFENGAVNYSCIFNYRPVKTIRRFRPKQKKNIILPIKYHSKSVSVMGPMLF